MDGRTDGWTDRHSYTDAWTHLKKTARVAKCHKFLEFTPIHLILLRGRADMDAQPRDGQTDRRTKPDIAMRGRI